MLAWQGQDVVLEMDHLSQSDKVVPLMLPLKCEKLDKFSGLFQGLFVVVLAGYENSLFISHSY